MNNGKQKGISLKLLNRVMVAITIVISFLLLISIVNVSKNYLKLKEATETYIRSQEDAQSLKSGSDYLTEQVRNYAVTGDRVYLDNYMYEAQVDQNRQKAVDSIHEILGDSVAYGHLKEALNYSNELMELEYESFLLILDSTNEDRENYPSVLKNMYLSDEDIALSKEEKREKAIDLVFNEEYQDYKQKIYENVDYCINELTDLTETAQNTSTKLLDRRLNDQYALIGILLLTMIFLVLVNRNTVVVPLQNNVTEMQEDAYLQVKGVQELKMLQTSYNEIYSKVRSDKQKLSHEATHDGLTGLLNRAAYNQDIPDLKDQEICFLMVDVDDFKGINDSYGHDVGDLVLQKVADTLKHSFRSEDRIYRLGGDEFVVVLMNLSEDLKDLVCRKVESIRERLKDDVDGVPAVTLSIGAAFSGREDSTGNIAKDADLALYEVKKQGKGQMLFYEGTA